MALMLNPMTSIHDFRIPTVSFHLSIYEYVILLDKTILELIIYPIKVTIHSIKPQHIYPIPLLISKDLQQGKTSTWSQIPFSMQKSKPISSMDSTTIRTKGQKLKSQLKVLHQMAPFFPGKTTILKTQSFKRGKRRTVILKVTTETKKQQRLHRSGLYQSLQGAVS